MAYLSREQPAPVEEGKPKRPDPVKATRSAVPCYFRWLQHISWVLACISSLVVMSVFWLAIVSFGILNFGILIKLLVVYVQQEY